MEEEYFTIRQVSEQLNIPMSKIRYYCNKGLVPHVRRNRSYQRIFTAKQCDWIFTLLNLCRAGFSIKDLQSYVELYYSSTLDASDRRKAMLDTHRYQLLQQIKLLNESVRFLDIQEDIIDEEQA